MFCGVPASARAQQIAFSQQTVGTDVAFSYRLRSPAGAVHDLGFRLPAREVEAAMQSFRDYGLVGLNQRIEQAIAEAARREAVAVRFALAADGRRSAHFDGAADALGRLQAQLPAVLEGVRRDYLGRHARYSEGDAIYVDYAAAVARARRVLPPLAAALSAKAKGASERELLQVALHFLQAIPYDDLIDVGRFGGVDFAPPPAMLKINAGDCDSKAVAMAGLAGLLAPQRRTLVVRTRTAPGVIAHAIALVDLPPLPGEARLSYRGRDYVAFEASGPALVPIGVVDQRIDSELREGRVVAVEVGS